MSGAAEVSQVVDIAALLERQNRPNFIYRLLAWSVFIMLLDGYSMAILALAAPYIMKEWGLGSGAFGIVFGLAQLGILVGAAVLGFVADTLGRRPVVIGGVLLFGVASLAVPFTHDVLQLTVIRVIAACALGGIKPVIYSLTIESAPRDMRASVIAIVYAGVSIGQLLAGIVAALMIPGYGWQSIFFLGAVAPIVAAGMLYLCLPESVRFLASRPARHEEVIVQARRADPTGLFDARTVFIQSDESPRVSDRDNFTPARLFEGPLLWITPLIWVSEICSSVVTFFYYSWTPTMARGIGVSSTSASYTMAAFSAGAIVGPLVLAWLIDRKDAVWLFVAPCVATLMLAIFAFTPLGNFTILIAFFLVGAFVIGIQMSIAGTFMQFYPTRIRANAVGWMILIGGAGSVGSPIIFGAIMQRGVPSHMMFLFSALPMFCLLLPTWLLVGQYRRRRDELVVGPRAAEVGAAL